MKRLVVLVATSGLLAMPVTGRCATNPSPVPSNWSLGPSDPSPACATTMIGFELAQTAQVQLVVWNADQSAAVRHLVDLVLPAGAHWLPWDGRDDLGVRVPNGQYVCRIVAQVDGVTVYETSIVLQIECDVAVGGASWGALKGMYRP